MKSLSLRKKSKQDPSVVGKKLVCVEQIHNSIASQQRSIHARKPMEYLAGSPMASSRWISQESAIAREHFGMCCRKLAQMPWSLYSNPKVHDIQEDDVPKSKDIGSQPLSKNLGLLKRAVASMISASIAESAAHECLPMSY